MRGSRSAAAALLAAVLVLSACSSEDPEPAPQAAPTPTPTTPPECPLTGTDVPDGVDIDRAAVAVKIENSPQARPQVGLDKADIVFEEIVEGGITRFMAIFHCGESSKVGPVRSARFDDPKIAKPFTRVIGYSGSNSIVDRELRKQKMIALNELNSEAFFRVPPGVLEIHNLFVNTERLRRAADKAYAPKAVLQFGEIKGKSKRARRVKVNFNPSSTIEYRWRGGAWRRFEAGVPFRVASGKQVAVENVLIQEVEVGPSPTIVDSANNPSPDITLVGKGRALLFRDGRVLLGKWRTKKEGRQAVFRTKGGKEFIFAPGAIWVELVPSGKGAWKGSFSYR